MSSYVNEVPSSRRAERRRQTRRRGPLSFLITFIADLLWTGGGVLLLFVVWQLWWTNLEANAVQRDAVLEVTEQWPYNKPSLAIEGKVWGILYLPAFGTDYVKPIGEGVGLDILNTIGIGHYPDTAVPGEVGNMGLAGHRQTHGEVFWDMDKLKDGDQAYVQTSDGIYTYTYRSTKIVHPSQGQVLFPVPGDASAKPTKKLLTFTTCHPPFTTNLRMVVQMEQTSFTPNGQSAPQEIREVVNETTGWNKGR